MRELRPRRWSLVGVAVLVMFLAGCQTDQGGIPTDAFPVVANADLAVGSQRLLIGLVTEDATSYASPDVPLEIDLYAPNAVTPTVSVSASFVWTVPDVRGLYTATVDFDEPGTWRGSVHSGVDDPPTRVIPFTVFEKSRTPSVGESAPAVPTPTLPQEDLRAITSDPDPDRRFYTTSLDAALESGRPTVVVFATPAWCETATCGPMLEIVKGLADSYQAVNFVHVEIYENPNDAEFDSLQVVDAVEVWGLPSEPWTFVIDAAGRISAKFEGTLDENELIAELEKMT